MMALIDGLTEIVEAQAGLLRKMSAELAQYRAYDYEAELSTQAEKYENLVGQRPKGDG